MSMSEIKDSLFDDILHYRNVLIQSCKDYQAMTGIPVFELIGITFTSPTPAPIPSSEFVIVDDDGIATVPKLDALRKEIEAKDTTKRVAPNIFGSNVYAILPAVEAIRKEAEAELDPARKAELFKRALFLECEIDNFSFGFDLDPYRANLFEHWEQKNVNGYPRMQKTGTSRPEVRIAPKKAKTVDDIVQWFRERAERQLIQEAIVSQAGPPVFGRKGN